MKYEYLYFFCPASRQVRRHEDQRVWGEEARRGAEAHTRGEHRRLSGRFCFSTWVCRPTQYAGLGSIFNLVEISPILKDTAIFSLNILSYTHFKIIFPNPYHLDEFNWVKVCLRQLPAEEGTVRGREDELGTPHVAARETWEEEVEQVYDGEWEKIEKSI